MALKQRNKAAGRSKDKAQRKAAKNMFGKENMAAANWIANQFLPDTLAADVSTDLSSEDTNLRSRFQDMSQGLNAQQYQAAREQQSKGLQSNLNTQMAELAKAQSRSRVYGAAGAAQQANALRADSEKRADLEQQNKLADINLIREGTKSYADLIKSQQDSQFEKQRYNTANDMALAASRLGAFSNTVGIGKTEEQQKRMEEIQRQMIEAAKG